MRHSIPRNSCCDRYGNYTELCYDFHLTNDLLLWSNVGASCRYKSAAGFYRYENYYSHLIDNIKHIIILFYFFMREDTFNI